MLQGRGSTQIGGNCKGSGMVCFFENFKVGKKGYERLRNFIEPSGNTKCDFKKFEPIPQSDKSNHDRALKFGMGVFLTDQNCGI